MRDWHFLHNLTSFTARLNLTYADRGLTVYWNTQKQRLSPGLICIVWAQLSPDAWSRRAFQYTHVVPSYTDPIGAVVADFPVGVAMQLNGLMYKPHTVG